MALKRIRLELTGRSDFPEGNSSCGYEFIAPLDRTGRLDFKKWLDAKPECTVRRFWRGRVDEHGTLAHRRGVTWVFAWPGGRAEEELTFPFGKHPLVQGEYVPATEHDGVSRTFRVADVRPVGGTGGSF